MDVSMNGVAWSLRSESVRNYKRDITATAAPESAYSSSTCAKKATSCQWMTTVVKSSQQLRLAARNFRTVRFPGTSNELQAFLALRRR